jgi:hypothetical protein
LGVGARCDWARGDWSCVAGWSDDEICDAFGVEMNFAAVVAAKAVEEFGEGPLRAVLPINERSDDR